MFAIMKIRDDRQMLKNIDIIKKILLAFVMYIPLSRFKIMIFKILGSHIGKNVYFGPGSLIVSNNYANINIEDGVFIAPGVLINVNNLKIGENSHIGYQCLFVGDLLKIGRRCNISNRTFVECSYSPIDIEDDVTIGANVIISSHDGAYKQVYNLEMRCKPILIKKKVFIGNGVIILPGIEIAEKTIVGAGAVVTRNIEKTAVVCGIPARTIKEFKDK